MAVCTFCGKETVGAVSCTESIIRIGTLLYHPIPFRSKRGTDRGSRCPDCNIREGGFHHVGCTVEACPRCGGRWVFCACPGIKKYRQDCDDRDCKVISLAGKFKREADPDFPER